MLSKVVAFSEICCNLHTALLVQATSAAREATTSAGGLSTSGATDQRVGCDVTKGVTVTLSPQTPAPAWTGAASAAGCPQ